MPLSSTPRHLVCHKRTHQGCWVCTDEDSHGSAKEQGLSVELAIPACIYLLYGIQLSGWDVVWVDHDLVRLALLPASVFI